MRNCKQCKEEITNCEYNARNGLCMKCWAQYNIPPPDLHSRKCWKCGKPHNESGLFCKECKDV